MTPNTTSYILRDIPEDLWKQFKHRAIDENLSLRALMLQAIEAYLKAKEEEK